MEILLTPETSANTYEESNQMSLSELTSMRGEFAGMELPCDDYWAICG